MENSPLVFQGRLSIADVVSITRYQDQLLLRGSLWYYGFLVTLVSSLWLCSWWAGKSYEVGIGAIGAWGYLAYHLFVRLPLVRRRQAKRHYRKHEAEYLESTVSLSVNHVVIETEAYRSEFSWKQVGLVADTPEGVLFFYQPLQAMFWLPEQLFEGNILREQVLDLAVRNGVPVRRM